MSVSTKSRVDLKPNPVVSSFSVKLSQVQLFKSVQVGIRKFPFDNEKQGYLTGLQELCSCEVWR